MKKFLILPVLMAAFQLNAVDPQAHEAFMENPFTPESHKFVTKMYRAAANAESREPRIQLSSLEVTPHKSPVGYSHHRLPELDNTPYLNLLAVTPILRGIVNTYNPFIYDGKTFQSYKEGLSAHKDIATQYQSIFGLMGAETLGKMYDKYESATEKFYSEQPCQFKGL